MLRDLWIGGGLGIGFYWWRTQTQRIEATVKQSQNDTQQLQQQLAQAQRELTIALEQRTSLETQISELNQLATDRAIELVQLQVDNADLNTQIAELSQKRTRKKRPVKAVAEEPLDNAATPLSVDPNYLEAVSEPIPLEAMPFVLDLELVQAKQIESVAANQLLQTVFVEEASPRISTALRTLPDTGLDAAHAAFLQTLGQQTTWSRQDLIQAAGQRGLLLDGALELINEAAFDCCNEALTEGEDPIELNSHVLAELLL